jgi:hypothetical protein
MKAVIKPTLPASFLAGVLLAGAFVPIAQAQECSERTIRGSYAFALQGSVAGIGPIAASGTTSFDGTGLANITGFINTRRGAPAIEVSIDGTYTVDPEECTGSATFQVPGPALFDQFQELEFEGVIVNRGEEIRYLITTPGIVFAGSSVRQESRR